MLLPGMFDPTIENEEDQTWALIQSLKERLELVERRVVDMEKKDEIRNKELAQLREEKKQWLAERQQYIETLRKQEQSLQASLVPPDTDRDFHIANESRENWTEGEATNHHTGL